MKKLLTLTVNGERIEAQVEPNVTLIDFLRDQLGLTGTRAACDTGACGACTVIIDGEPILSCMMLAIRCRDKDITTIEGLARDGKLHPLQESAIMQDAVQCGFCTAGWLLSAKVLLDRNPSPSREEIRTAIAGNLCRCASYQKIEESILACAEKGRIENVSGSVV
ncbi:aerobic carbon-monoxide dehydrogenase small subunit [Anaerolineae bacterium]|nr:aerobic carbon-monoxide dehydrogenase small subunit [Anaerolineae bacterium]